MNKRQSLILLIGRFDLDPLLIPPLKVIIPALKLLSEVYVYTSMNCKINNNNIYENLVNHLTNQTGPCIINQALEQILKNHDKQNFRVCILGNQSVDWDIIMKYKRKKIVIDTTGSHPRLPQISYVTGGIHHNITELTMVKTFLCYFSLSTTAREDFKMNPNDTSISFSLNCKCCKPSKQLKSNLIICSICLCVYCPQKQTRPKQCKNCHNSLEQNLKL